MLVPDYYDLFECICGECEHNCCLGGWQIDIDEAAYEKYQKLQGNLGDRIRHETEDIEEDGEITHTFRLRHGRCPFLTDDGFCEIQKTEGEKALGQICREYPRYTISLGDQAERTLSLSCEEAGRILFTKQDRDVLVPYEGNEASEADENARRDAESEESEQVITPDELRVIRDRAVSLLQDRWLTIDERIIHYLMYCQEIQERINAGEEDLTDETAPESEEAENENASADDAPLPADFDLSGLFSGGFSAGSKDQTADPEEEPDPEEAFAESFRKRQTDIEPASDEEMVDFYEERHAILGVCEVLGEEWQELFEKLENWDGGLTREGRKLSPLQRFMRQGECSLEREGAWEHLMVYYTWRYFPRAVYDGDVLGKAEFAVFMLLCIRDLELLRYQENASEGAEHPAGKLWTLADRIDIVRIFSRQVEHSDGNVDAIFEELLFSECGKADNLIRQIRY